MALRKKTVAAIVGATTAVLIAIAVITVVNIAGNRSEASDATSTAVRFNLTKDQNRIRLDQVPAAVDALKASGFEPVEAGRLTVVTSTDGSPPLNFYADDNTTVIGNEPDIAQLIADGLGLELNLKTAAWADWPLGIQSGKYDLVTSNVTVTEERKELYDFASYRQDLLGFYVKADSKVDSLKTAKDVAGLRIIVGSGTNQEKVLQTWDKENKEKGLKPVDFQYYDDQAAANLAIQSGRADAWLGPNASGAYLAASTNRTKLVGTLDGGWPETAPIAAATDKGNGLAEPVNIVLNEAIADGAYAKVLKRWGLGTEAIEKSELNPPGLPKS
ncbi:ABC transporter substrate-binding protein [Saxibacter everestensis]|uniref:ABC transporter substrate-binding protein n=1 Tax=Saxibacter everestensis TaxID=2909229 RepID=A0ABY8QPD7_9MICO|nr:ABC transporter substrate-binding protein [Brevibacteriaceae bacterium ZFBP1038]